jgi:hypothetical protein
LFLAGSCFTEQIGTKLANHKFQIIDNPHGILFNPISISNAISSYIQNKRYTESELFFHNELWGSWDHHTKFSSIHQSECLNKINASQEAAHKALKNGDWLILTLGSSFAYQIENERVVANCHKVPTDKFVKKLFSTSEIYSELDKMIVNLKIFNPKLKIVFTISPVRHLRDGFVENNRSKANLITAVHQLIEYHSSVFYFPSYELIIDDLRDYRFFAEDMVHPNYAATNYVWEKFLATCIDEDSKQFIKEISIIRNARNHKSFNPESVQHQKFLSTNLEKVFKLKDTHPYIDFTDEISFFSQNKL